MLGIYTNQNAKYRLKILPNFFKDVRSGKKQFEIRKMDRDFKEGDTIELAEFNGLEFTGNSVFVKITYLLYNCEQYGLSDGFCIFGFDMIGEKSSAVKMYKV